MHLSKKLKNCFKFINNSGKEEIIFSRICIYKYFQTQTLQTCFSGVKSRK